MPLLSGAVPRRLAVLALMPVVAALAVALVLADGPARTPPPGSTDPALASVIERFDAAQARIERISARFEEVKTLALLKEPIVQSGEFFHTKPDKFLWEYTAPEPKMLMLNGRDIVAYYPKQKRAEEIHTRFSKRIVKYLGLGSVLKDLGEEYDMSLGKNNKIPGTDLLVLTPKGRMIQKRLAEIRIWVDRTINQPRQLEYLEPDGDSARITFDRIEINPEISVSKYSIQLPEGVTVTNTLSGFFGGGSGR
jgi:outer membrane lipoprotein carrier protein